MSDYFFLSLKRLNLQITYYVVLPQSAFLFLEDKLYLRCIKKQCIVFLFLWEVHLCLEIMLVCCFNVSMRDSLPFEPIFSEIRKLQFSIILDQQFCYRRDDKRAQSSRLYVCTAELELWVMS